VSRGLSRKQRRILSELANGPGTVSTIGMAVGMLPFSTWRALENLRKRGLVSRIALVHRNIRWAWR